MTSPASTILITGATGMVGTELAQAYEADGHKVLRAVRHPVKDPATEVFWDPTTGEIEKEKLEGLDAVIHLAGANIAGKRWSAAYKQVLLESRTKGTTLISNTLAELNQKPKVLACASAIGYYGDRGHETLTEEAAPGEGFLPDVCMQWEQACQPAREAGIRVANMRIGVVLSTKGGALATMLTPFKLGAGGILGNGKQFFSWIALDDLVEAIRFVVSNDSFTGPVNLVSPQAVTNREFTKSLGKAISRPTLFPMPAFAARLAFGEMADALLLASAHVVPEKLAQAGFPYRFPQLQAALQHVLQK